MTGIYKITSPSNRVYIGQSVDIEKRWYNYSICVDTKGQPRLYNSFLKHGVEKHLFEVIEECEFEKLNERERYWQEFYDVLSKKGLNCILTKTNDKSGSLSEETKKKISIANKGKVRSNIFKDKLSKIMKGDKNPFYGKKQTKEAINKRRHTIIKNKSMSGENNGMYGKKHSLLSKLMMSKTKIENNKNRENKNKGIKRSEENRRKISLSKIGKPSPKKGIKLSEEQKKKISESKTGLFTKFNNPNNKKVINNNTGEIHSCLHEVSLLTGIKYDALRARIYRGKGEYSYL